MAVRAHEVPVLLPAGPVELVGMLDPPRAQVAEAVRRCRRAGRRPARRRRHGTRSAGPSPRSSRAPGGSEPAQPAPPARHRHEGTDATGHGGADALYGQGGNDGLYGGEGHDLLWGGLGAVGVGLLWIAGGALIAMLSPLSFGTGILIVAGGVLLFGSVGDAVPLIRESMRKLGFKIVTGTEIVPELLRPNVFFSEVHQIRLVNNFAEVVTMFDVIEHLIPGDDELACKELARVASKHVLITANNRPSFNKAGHDLHINKRPYEEWDALFRAWFPGAVTWIKGDRNYVSEAWRIDL